MLRSIRELPAVAWIDLTPHTWQSELVIFRNQVIVTVVNLILLSIYIAGVIWLVRVMT